MKHYYISTRKPIVSGYARSLLLAVMAALCTLPLAAETDEATGLEFTIETSDPETAAITGIGNCTDIELSIPSTVTAAGKTYTVTRIADDAFYHDMLLYSVVLPESVLHIAQKHRHSLLRQHLLLWRGERQPEQKGYQNGVDQEGSQQSLAVGLPKILHGLRIFSTPIRADGQRGLSYTAARWPD